MPAMRNGILTPGVGPHPPFALLARRACHRFRAPGIPLAHGGRWPLAGGSGVRPGRRPLLRQLGPGFRGKRDQKPRQTTVKGVHGGSPRASYRLVRWLIPHNRPWRQPPSRDLRPGASEAMDTPWVRSRWSLPINARRLIASALAVSGRLCLMPTPTFSWPRSALADVARPAAPNQAHGRRAKSGLLAGEPSHEGGCRRS
jgi:hypothetical protein